MLELFFEIAICVFAVYGGYSVLRSIKRRLFYILEKKAKKNE